MRFLERLLGKKARTAVHPMVKGAFELLESEQRGDWIRACHSALDGAGRPSDLKGRRLVKAFVVAVRYCFPLYTGTRKNRQVLSEAVTLIDSYVEGKEVSDSNVSHAGEMAEAVYLEAKATWAAAFDKWKSLYDAGDRVKADSIELKKASQSRLAALSVAQAMAALGYVRGIEAPWACKDKEAVDRLFWFAGQNTVEAVESADPESVPAVIADLVSICHEPV